MSAIIDYRGKTPKKTSSGIPLVTAKIIKDGCIQPVTEFIAEDAYEAWMRRGIPECGDIVLTVEAPLGEVAQLDNRKIALAQRVITLRGMPDLLENDFLKYLLTSRHVQHQLDSRATGTTVKGIKQSELREVLLLLPELPEQKAIAHILGTLDDKIELDRQMNQTLEAMAQALFKSWFVDFDPVIDNALAAGNPIPDALQARAEQRQQLRQSPPPTTSDSHPNPAATPPLPESLRQQFPNRFTYHDTLGWIPEGWEHKQLEEIIGLAYGKSLPAKSRVEGKFPVYGSGGVTGTHNAPLVKGPGIIVGRKGTVGSLHWCEQDFFPIDTVFYVENLSDLPLELIYRMLREMDIAAMAADSAVPGVNRNAVLSARWLLPPSKIAKLFLDQVKPIDSKRRANTEETNSLAKLRNTLLPKLISGELRVPEAEKMVAAASE